MSKIIDRYPFLIPSEKKSYYCSRCQIRIWDLDSTDSPVQWLLGRPYCRSCLNDRSDNPKGHRVLLIPWSLFGLYNGQKQSMKVNTEVVSVKSVDESAYPVTRPIRMIEPMKCYVSIPPKKEPEKPKSLCFLGFLQFVIGLGILSVIFFFVLILVILVGGTIWYFLS